MKNKAKKTSANSLKSNARSLNIEFEEEVFIAIKTGLFFKEFKNPIKTRYSKNI